MLCPASKILKITLPILLLGGLFFAYYHFNPTHYTGQFPTCPIYAFTDTYCPGCGSQRAIHHLLHLDILTAFRYNPLMVLTLPLLFYALFLTYINFAFGTKHRVKLFYSNTFIYVYFGFVIIYWIARNIPLDSLNFLVPPA